MSDPADLLKQARDALGLPPDEPLVDGAARIRRERDAEKAINKELTKERDAQAAARNVVAHHRDILEREFRRLEKKCKGETET